MITFTVLSGQYKHKSLIQKEASLTHNCVPMKGWLAEFRNDGLLLEHIQTSKYKANSLGNRHSQVTVKIHFEDCGSGNLSLSDS